VAQNRNIDNVIQEATQINKFTYNGRMFFFQILPYNVTQDFSTNLLLINVIGQKYSLEKINNSLLGTSNIYNTIQQKRPIKNMSQ
jgi:hypothetical protein